MAGASSSQNPFLPAQTLDPFHSLSPSSSSFAAGSFTPPTVSPTAMSSAIPASSAASAQIPTLRPQVSAYQLPGSHSHMGTRSAVPGEPEMVENNNSPFLAPVTYDVRGKHPKWEPLSYQSIKELC